MLILHWKPPQPIRQFHAHLALDNSVAKRVMAAMPAIVVK
jgi:hypothetical protein